MFCQNCGAELRLEEGFCAVCGASAPRPALRQEPEERASKPQRLNTPSRTKSAPGSGARPDAGSSLLNPPPTRTASQPDPRQIRSFQAIRQASGQRSSMHSLAPVASLMVPPSPSAQPAPQAEPAPAQPPSPAPTAAPDMPLAAPVPPAHPNRHAPALNPASVAPTAQNNIPGSLNGYHLVEPTAPARPGTNGHAPTAIGNGNLLQQASAPISGAAPLSGSGGISIKGIRVPADIPNRLALSALACMFLSFLLPWVIIGGTRATPLSIGWPVIVPLAAILAVGATIVLPERTLYTRFILALPFAFGCFALGSALVVFLVSSAIAANTVGPAFLGVDIGFLFFTLASFLLASAGYFKLLRELPLLLAGHIRLAPLPAMLERLTSNPTPRPQTSQDSALTSPDPAHAEDAETIDHRGPSASGGC